MTCTKVFISGNSQAVRIPKEFHIDYSDLYIKKIGSTIILFPQENRWENLERSLAEFSDDFMSEGRNQPVLQTREEFQMYLLDTNICIYLIKNKFPILKQRLLECDPDEVFVSSITVAEMEYGASKSQYREKNRQAMLNFFSSFGNILDFSTEDTEAYGIIRAYLEKSGKVIGPYDMQIAAQGLARNLTVITNNYDEFSRIPGLKVEDWTKE